MELEEAIEEAMREMMRTTELSKIRSSDVCAAVIDVVTRGSWRRIAQLKRDILLH